MTSFLVRSTIAGALVAVACLPACGGDAPREPDQAASAPSPNVAAASAPEARTVTLSPRATHHMRAAHPQSHHGGSVGDSFGTPSSRVAPSGFTTSGGDSVGIYTQSGDATSTDSVSNQGGTVLQGAHLQLIFWGTQWPNPPTPAGSPPGASQSQVVTAVQHLLASTYLDELKQYGFQTADVRGVWDVLGDPPASFAFSDLQDLVWNLIDQGTFPEPGDPGGDNLYVVFMPPSATTNSPGVLAAHGSAVDYDGASADWTQLAWIGYGTLDFITEAFSHELAESISDPQPQSPAWLMEKIFNNDGNEIGDACNHAVDSIDGILVQGYWSQQQRACVIPFMPPPTITGVSPNQGPQSGGETVTITGTNFDTFGSTKIFFAGTPASSVSCSSHTTCTVKTPAGQGVEFAQATVNDFTFSGSTASQYLFGPYPPNCSATYSCQPNHVGAATISCPAGLAGLTLQRLNGGTWQTINASTTQTPDTFVDYDDPPPYTEIDYHVTATTSDGTTVGPMLTVYSHSCACYTQLVCELPSGQQIYPQPTSPPNWCTVKGGHWVNKEVCPA